MAGTVALPSRVPVGEPARTSRVPPDPADETRAVSFLASARTYGVKEIQSPEEIAPTVRPPCADSRVVTVTPEESPKCSA